MPQLFWIIPLEGGRPDNALPGGPPGHISGGPVHPGGPTDPGYGHPGWGPADPGYDKPIHHPGHPDHGLPSGPPGHISNRPPGSGIPHPGNRPPGSGSGNRPDNALPEGEPVPPDTINPPLPEDMPPPYDDKVVVAVKRPGAEWKVTAYEADAFPDQGLPPSGQPK